MRKVNNHHKSKTEQIKMLRETNIESHSFSLILILNHIGYAVINILWYRHTHTHTAKKLKAKNLLLYYIGIIKFVRKIVYLNVKLTKSGWRCRS